MKTILELQSLRTRVSAGLFAATTALPLLLLTANAHADACLGGPRGNGSGGSAGSAGSDAVSHNGLSQRNVGMGLVALASLSTAWLALRRSDRNKKHE